MTVTLDRNRPQASPSVGARHEELGGSFEDEVFADMSDWEQDVELAGLEQAFSARDDREWTTADERQVLESPHFAVGSRFARQAAAPRRARAWLAPVLLFMGIAGLTSGLTFLGLSVYDNRPSLWDLGVPVIAFGQLALIMWVALEIGIPSPVSEENVTSRTPVGKRAARRAERHEVLSAPVFTRSRRAARRGI